MVNKGVVSAANYSIVLKRCWNAAACHVHLGRSIPVNVLCAVGIGRIAVASEKADVAVVHKLDSIFVARDVIHDNIAL